MRLSLLLAFFLASVVSIGSHATDELPKGKPFQIIANALASIDVRLEQTVARLAEAEDKQREVSLSIALLDLETQRLSEVIEGISSDLLTVKEGISVLESLNQELFEQVQESASATAELELSIAENEILIEMLHTDIELAVSSLQLKIDANSELQYELASLVSNLNRQVELQQALLTKTCPDSFVLRGFEEGELICERSFGATDNPIELFDVIKTKLIVKAAGSFALFEPIGDGLFKSGGASIRVECPPGSSIMGGGVADYPEYFLDPFYSRAAYSGIGGGFLDAWEVAVKTINRGSPLWNNYNTGAYFRSGYSNDNTLIWSAFALCARARLNQPLSN